MAEPSSGVPKRRRKWRRLLLGFTSLLIAVTAGGWILAKTYGPEFIRGQLETVLSAVVGTPVRVKELVILPSAGELRVAGFSIARAPESAENMVQLGRALVRVRVPRFWPPDIVFTIDVDDLDLQLDEEPAAAQQSPEPLEIVMPSRFEFGPVVLRLDSVRLKRGSFVYRDRAAGLEVSVSGVNARLEPDGKGFAARVSADSFTFRMPEVAESAQQLDLRGSIDPERIAVDRLTLIRDGQALVVKGLLLQPFNEIAFDLKVRGKIPLKGLNPYLKADDWPISGLLELEGTLRGPIPSLAAHWTVDVATLSAGPLAAGRIHVQGEWDKRVLRISELRARVFGGSLQGAFSMVPERPSETRATMNLTGISLETLDSVAGEPLGLRGNVALDASLAGDLSRPKTLRGQVVVKGHDLVLPSDGAELGPGRVEITATLASGLLTFSNLKGRWRAGRLSGRGKVALAGPFEMRADFSGNMKAIAKAFDMKGFDGKAAVEVRSSGDWQQHVAEGKIQGSLVSATGSEIGRLEVPFRVREKMLQLTGALAHLGESRLETSMLAEWSEKPRIDGKLRASPVRMEDLAIFMPPDLKMTGAFELLAQASGTQTVWRGSGTLNARELSVANVFLKDLRTAFSGNQKGIAVEQLSVFVNGALVKAQGDWAWSRTGNVSLQIEPTELATIQGIPKDGQLRGLGQAIVRGSITGNVVSASGRISLKKVAVQELSLGDGDLSFDVKDSRLTSSLSFPGLRLSGEAAGKLGPGENIDVKLLLDDFTLEPIIAAFAPDLSETLEGKLTGVAKTSLPYDDPSKARGSLRIEPIRLTFQGEGLQNDGPIVLEAEDGEIRLKQLVLKSSGGGALSASGILSGFESANFTAAGKLPLKLLAAFSPEVSQASGTLEVNAAVSGTLEKPILTGHGKVVDGGIALASYPDAIREIQAKFGFTPKGARLEQLSALVGSGSIKGNGQIGLEGFKVGTYRAQLALRNLPVAPVDGLRTAWNVDLELLGFDKRGILQGEANLVRGDYSRELSILSLIFENRTASAGSGTGEPPPLDLVVKVRVNLNDNFRVRTPLARLRLGGSLNVEGPVAQPVVFGAIEVRNGYIMFQRRRFELSRATVNFVDPRQIDPVLDIEATAKLRQYEVTLRLEGRPHDLTINLSSDPSLPEEDLLSLVAFGVTREQFGKSAPGVLAGQAAQLIADDLFGSGGVLDNIDMDTQGEDGVTVTARVDQDTTVSFANGKNGKRRVRVEHQLLGPLLIAGGQSEGGFETDVVLRFRFR